jgi:hypothetical protein
MFLIIFCITLSLCVYILSMFIRTLIKSNRIHVISSFSSVILQNLIT